MNRQKWSAWLEASIQDYRLDDSERRELQSELQDSVLSHEDRAYLRNMSFKLVQQEIQNQGDAAALVRWLERVVKVLDNVMSENSADTASSWFSPGRACASGIIEQLKLARHSVDICVFTPFFVLFKLGVPLKKGYQKTSKRGALTSSLEVM